MTLKTVILSWLKHSTPCMNPYIPNSPKCKIICSATKQIIGCLGMGVGEGSRRALEGHIKRGHEQSFGGDGHVLYLERSNVFMGVYVCQNLHCTLYVQFIVCESCSIKLVLKHAFHIQETSCFKYWLYLFWAFVTSGKLSLTLTSSNCKMVIHNT